MDDREYIGEVFDYIVKSIKYNGVKYIALLREGIVGFASDNVDGETRATSDALPFLNIKSETPDFSGITFRLEGDEYVDVIVHVTGGVWSPKDLTETRKIFMDNYVLNDDYVLSNTYYY